RDWSSDVCSSDLDIGGPTMIRAAAKNFFFVGVVTAPEDYDAVAAEIETTGGALSLETRRRLAHRAFEHTAAYDRAIADYFGRTGDVETRRSESLPDEAEDRMPSRLALSLPKAQPMRYGENPHQQAALYGDVAPFFETLHGKELSFNNLMDLAAALWLIDEFRDDDPACAILKHTNPCGVAVAPTLEAAYRAAFETDRQSP